MLWKPSEERINRTNMKHFMAHIAAKYPLASLDYQGLWEFSVEQSETFWLELMHYFDLRYEGDLHPVNTDWSFKRYGWFPNLRLNFAENLLAKGKKESEALVSLLESGTRRSLSYGELQHRVALFQQEISACIDEGDVLAAYMPNIPDTVIAMLATTGLGGVFTSTSCDFGIEGVVDRFGQSKPRILVACAVYQYNGKCFDCLEKISEIVRQVDSIEKVIVVDFLETEPDVSDIPNAVVLNSTVDTERKMMTPTFVKREFSDPVYIMYSSGTTGKPKCIVHSVGGVLLQHIKELGLHSDMQENKNIMFFTTCGWMMWNWLVSALYFGGTITLYEGSPSYPSLKEFFKIIDREQLNIFGTSPKFLRALEDKEDDFIDLNLASLETVLCTGAPLLPEQFDFVYEKLKSDVLLASISGGTDIVGCFFLGNPMGAVYRGELQCRGLGMDVASFDEEGHALNGTEGELVCRKSFPSRPIYFLNDPGAERLHEAYFSHFPDVWYHGDFILITEHGGAKFFGRSDATLNPGGVRIGTSEIYRQTETLNYIEDAVCIGKNRDDGDIDVLLFVKLVDGETLTDARVAEIKKRIKDNTTPRHVPRDVIAVRDIPYTRSGKKIELAVARIVNGKAITNQEAIANPESLEEYRDISVG